MRTLFALLLLCSTCLAGDVFVIGNSLTWDMQRRLADLSELGAHVVSNQELGEVLERLPPEISRGAVDWVAAAESGEWSCYTVQPFGDELLEETIAAVELVQATTGRQVYVYAAMPFRSKWGAWGDDYAGGTYQARAAYHEALLERLDGVRLIPAAHVAQRVVADGLHSVEDLYRDQIHASYGIGASILGDTAWATITDSYPAWSPYARQIWAELHPGDFDRDGDCDSIDFLVWQIDPRVGDFLDWQSAFFGR